MKQSLLVSAILFIAAGGIIAQNQSRELLKADPSVANKEYPLIKNSQAEVQFSTSPALENSSSRKEPSVLGTAKLLGYTCYELQTQYAATRSIINHPDGTISFIWMADDNCTDKYLNRGTAYNYWNGTSMLIPGGAAKSIEKPLRTGFGQLGLLGNGQEVIFAHKNTPFDFQMSTNISKGSNTWTGISAGATLQASAVPGFTKGTGTELALWGRIAIGGIGGNTIHLIAHYYPGATGKEGPVIKGVFCPTVYSRSTDGGQSWDYQSVMLPGYDSTRTLGSSPEAYAIDAEDTTLAIIYGGIDKDVTLWKSTNNGTTFQKTFIDSAIYAPTIDSTNTTDTLESNDGAVTVVVAPANKIVHVAYSTVLIKKNGFLPGTAKLIYWNDKAKQKITIPIFISDVDGPQNGGNNNSKWDIAKFTTNLNNPMAASPPSARYGNRALLTIPSIAIDGNNVFILFSLVCDADSTPDGRSFRDIWVVASQDGGVSFGRVQNITCSVGEEEFFSSLAKRVDNNLHFMYTHDDQPGTAQQNGQPITAAEVRYSIVSKAKVLAGTASCSASDATNIPEHRTSNFAVSDNYPNPANGLTYFDVTMRQNASISVELFNNLGQRVYVSSEKLSAGKHTLSVDANTFSPGLYFYSIKSGNDIVTGKMTIVK